MEVPDYAHRLPESIAHFTTKGVYDDENTHLSFSQGGGHGGSHPHLVHELLDAIVNNREAYPNARQGANITCSGILAHESALNDGKKIMLPEWTLANGPKASAYAPEAALALAK